MSYVLITKFKVLYNFVQLKNTGRSLVEGLLQNTMQVYQTPRQEEELLRM